MARIVAPEVVSEDREGDAVDLFRAREQAVLDALRKAHWPKKGQAAHASVMLAILEREAKLQGTDRQREGGYTEIPIKGGRFWKILGDIYGRSPGMDALPSALEAIPACMPPRKPGAFVFTKLPFTFCQLGLERSEISSAIFLPPLNL